MLESGFYNMNCMDGMAQFPDKFFESNAGQNGGNAIDVRKIALPDANDPNPGLAHVSILRSVEAHSLFLARVWVWVKTRIAMPVISIKLDNHILAWHISINSKPAADNVLRNKIQPQLFQKLVSRDFKPIREHLTLIGIHQNKTLLKPLAVIAALDRAKPLAFENRRAQELFTANLANELDLVSGLISVGAFYATSDGLACSANWRVEGLSAVNASLFHSVLDAVRRLVRVVALGRAELDAFCARFHNQLSTTRTMELAQSVLHPCRPPVFKSINIITQRPVEINRWLDPDYYKAASDRLAKAKAQVSMMELAPVVQQIGLEMG